MARSPGLRNRTAKLGREPAMADDSGILPPADAATAENNALAIVRRLARSQHLPAELIAMLDGPLADAVAVAADYAGDAITEATRARVGASIADLLAIDIAIPDHTTL